MNDKELLELAAKAAGLKPTTNALGQPSWTTGLGSGCFAWNPLQDDGDALRLAVKLEMTIDIDDKKVIAFGVFYGYLKSEAINDDPYAAARRAIVRAAAEIGKEMK